MTFKASLVGIRRLKRDLAREERAVRSASRRAVAQTSGAIKKAIRRDVDRIFSGGSAQFRRRKTARKVSGAVRDKVFDNKRRGSAAIVYSKFGRRGPGGRFIDYLGPYLTGRDITPRRGRFMAIPLQRGKKARKPENFNNLHAVTINNRLFLVRSTRSRTTFMFMLIPRVRVTKRLRARRIAIREAKKMGIRVTREFRRAA